MNMKQHILAALGEVFTRWEACLAGLTEEQIATPGLPSGLSVKDVIAHLRAWQQRSLARIEAARLDQEPEFPKWPAELDPDGEGDTDRINAWIYAAHQEQTWAEVHQRWRAGFQLFLEAAEAISEKDLLDSGRYAWLNGYPLAYILLSSYDHHQEHFEKLAAWLEAHGKPLPTL